MVERSITIRYFNYGVTRPPESYKEQERIKECIEHLQTSVTVIQKPNIHQKYVIIDNRLVWYGSINLLSFGSSEESIMRLESRDLAAELEVFTE
jgi:phosphatidylserine/phosphatidylglycerophosphate/cardiolipin synthase-like enzyme